MPSCAPGCECKRHNMRSCSVGCGCGKHRFILRTWRTGFAKGTHQCAEDCTCRKHERASAPWMIGNKNTAGKLPWNAGLTKETDERVAKYARGVREHMERCSGSCGGASCNPQNPSSLSWTLAQFLVNAGFNIALEQRFGRYSVDVLVLDEWLAFEADGEYWHEVNKTDYDARDEYLLREHGLPVIRLTENEIKGLS